MSARRSIRWAAWLLVALSAPANAQDDRSPCLEQCQASAEACMAGAGEDADKAAACAQDALSCIEACGVTLPS